MKQRVYIVGTQVVLVLCAALAVVWGLGLFGVRRPHPDMPRLVILYAPSALNTGFLSPYDSQVLHTPNLDRFAQQSVVFEQHHTESGEAGIDYASIVTGLQSDGHGIYQPPETLRDELLLIAEAYAAAGYDTFAWADHDMASPALGYTQGIPEAHTYARRLTGVGDAEFEAILDRLQSDPTYRAFIFTNFMVTQLDYVDVDIESVLKSLGTIANQPGPDVARLVELYLQNHLSLSMYYDATVERLGLSSEDQRNLAGIVARLYASAVSDMDGAFGSVLNAIDQRGLMDQSLIVFTAANGDVVRRDRALSRWSHALQLLPEEIHVPLIIRSPLIEAGRYADVTRSIDVLPTMLGLTFLSPTRYVALPGVDLSPAMDGTAPAPQLSAFSHVGVLPGYFAERMADPAYAARRPYFSGDDVRPFSASVRKGDWNLRLRGGAGQDWRVEAFNVAQDPQETTDVFDLVNAEHADMADRLMDYRGQLVDGYIRMSRARSMPRDEAEKLKQLGYIR